MLPDSVLLEIFWFYKEVEERRFLRIVWNWHLFVHVCRRWRQVVFGSPIHLNLQIFCTSRTPARKYLGIWPALPIFIDFDYYSPLRHGNNPSSGDNIVTAFEHVDRVCGVRLRATGSELETFAMVMQEPFPVLTSLYILSDVKAPVLPAEFLGGSAPLLQKIYFDGIPFPALPTLLLSTSDLVTLDLKSIPPSGYISPEAMAVGLAALPRLKTFIIQFRSASPRPDRIHPPPATRTVLPVLTYFHLQGASEYLEDLVARIDAPQLDEIHICYLNQLDEFRVAQLPRFIDRSVGPKLTQFRFAQVGFYGHFVNFHTYRNANDSESSSESPSAPTAVLCEGLDWQVSHMAQVLSHFSATLSNVVHLKLEVWHEEDEEVSQDYKLEATDDVEWLHLLHQFPTVKTLHVPHELAGNIALALEDIAWEAIAPSLDLIYLADQPASSIEKFVAARQLSGRPVTVVETKMDFDEKLESYVSK